MISSGLGAQVLLLGSTFDIIPKTHWVRPHCTLLRQVEKSLQRSQVYGFQTIGQQGILWLERFMAENANLNYKVMRNDGV